MTEPLHVDFVVIGSGPAGQKAAICAAKAGKRVVLVERERASGGACVHHGTIPSKTLRETVLAIRGLSRRTGGILRPELREDLEVASLMTRVDGTVRAHEAYIGEQLRRNGIDVWHGQARFTGERALSVRTLSGETRRVSAEFVVLATGTKPRTPPGVAVDHEHILDSDSILSMTYLPRSLIVLGAGVIASEYASIFASLDVKVVMVDPSPRPVSFLDAELTDVFTAAFEARGGRWVPQMRVESARYDGLAGCEVFLQDGSQLRADKVLCALGRVANVDSLDLAAAGIETTPRGLVKVDEHCRTTATNVYAVGDVIGPPALASSAMEQGRRAARHALGLANGAAAGDVPICVYTIPELASFGLSEAEAVTKFGGAVVGKAPFSELARAHVAAFEEGFIKLVATPDGQRVVGVQVVGDGASELVHVGQMAILGNVGVDALVEATFNFPTLAEGYRVAALEIVKRRTAG